MPHYLLSPDEMAEADRLAIAGGPFDGPALMENAGRAVFREILRLYPQVVHFDVLCGPGNNGGDGYVVARLLMETGLDVVVWRKAGPREGSDAAVAERRWRGHTRPLADFAPRSGGLVVDALFGAGLSKPLEGAAARAVEVCSGVPLIAIDLPSGISGASGKPLGAAFRADLTVTFFRKKPGHLLLPGRLHCGELVLADIGIPDTVLDAIGPTTFENDPGLWMDLLPRPAIDTHKYARGHAAVFSGGPSATGAARLAAQAAARVGAGAVTVLSPPDAMLVNAAHLTAIMVARVADAGEVERFAAERKLRAAVLGPGFGVGETARAYVQALLTGGSHELAGLVLDADGITSFRERPEEFFAAARSSRCPLVLTPHEGEFARLFPDLAGQDLSRLDRARHSAERAHAVVVLKGSDTVIASPDGRAAVNANATPYLATAGSGDVLAGLVAGLLAQQMPAWEAACAGVWIHARAAADFGPGLIADDLPGLVPSVQRELLKPKSR